MTLNAVTLIHTCRAVSGCKLIFYLHSFLNFWTVSLLTKQNESNSDYYSSDYSKSCKTNTRM